MKGNKTVLAKVSVTLRRSTGTHIWIYGASFLIESFFDWITPRHIFNAGDKLPSLVAHQRRRGYRSWSVTSTSDPTMTTSTTS